MNLSENIKIAFRSVRSNMLRAVLTLLIIAFGIMALVGILTAIDSILYSLSSNFSFLGANSFVISPKDNDGARGNRGGRNRIGERITYDEAFDFKEHYNFPALVALSTDGSWQTTVRFQDKKTNPNIRFRGVDNNFFAVRGYELEAGRNFSETEINNGVNRAVIGRDLVNALFDKKPERAINQDISVNNIRYRVIGVLKSKGSSMSQNSDRVVMIPVLNAKYNFASDATNFQVNVGVNNAANIDEATATAVGTMRQVRKLRLGQEDDFEIFKSDGLLTILKENTVKLRMAAIAIGLMTLLGAAIGLMNIMLVSVTERTKEIGISKAIGATSRNILVQFLTEAIVICQLGGLLGIVLGIIVGNIVSFVTGGSFYIPWDWIILGIITCMVVGLFSGLYPALKAARLDPIESLRYE
ncbi:MAG: ABC transporter permease [Saprospiraceae bacterium]|nr:ABC transporter permease [Saprospiraceae bacterium]MBP7680023.1 ABC transporter permease [Saprospiraceae bacterium]